MVHWKKIIISIAMSAILIMGNVAITAADSIAAIPEVLEIPAEDGDVIDIVDDEGNSEHQYDESCGYIEAQTEMPCDYACMDVDGDGIVDHCPGCACGPALEELPCDYEPGQLPEVEEENENEPGLEGETQEQPNPPDSESEITEGGNIARPDSQFTEKEDESEAKEDGQDQQEPPAGVDEETPADEEEETLADMEVSGDTTEEGDGSAKVTEQENEADGSQEDASQEEAPREDVPQEGASQEDVPQEEAPREDVPQEGASQEDVSQEDVPQEDASKEEASQEDTPQEDVSQEDTLEEDLSKEDTLQEDVPQEEVLQEDILLEEILQEEEPLPSNEPAYEVEIPSQVVLSNGMDGFTIQTKKLQADMDGSLTVTVEGTESPDRAYYALYCGESCWRYQLQIGTSILLPTQNKAILNTESQIQEVKVLPAENNILYAGTYTGFLTFHVVFEKSSGAEN